MASKKSIELQGMAVEAIEAEVKQLRSDLTRMSFDHGSKGLQNPKDLGVAKKEIARLLTELRARDIKGLSAEQLAKRSKIRLRRK